MVSLIYNIRRNLTWVYIYQIYDITYCLIAKNYNQFTWLPVKFQFSGGVCSVCEGAAAQKIPPWLTSLPTLVKQGKRTKARVETEEFLGQGIGMDQYT